MTNKILVHSSFLASSKGTILNVYVSEERLTVRHLKITNLNSNTSISPLSHELCYNEDHIAFTNTTPAVISHNNINYEVLYEDFITLAELSNSWKVGQVCLIAVPSTKSISYKVSEIYPINLYASTYTSKNAANIFSNELKSSSDIGACIRLYPTNSDNLLTADCILYCYSKENLITNLNFSNYIDKHDQEALDLFYNKVNTNIVIKGNTNIQSNSTEILNVEVLRNGILIEDPITLKLECVDGYAPHQRVEIINGRGSFKVTALGLVAGETMRIKLNDGFFTAKAEYIFSVI